ncbi:MAG: hypothetical protein ACYDA8_22360, partial [Deferrisomatales bacterium]
GLLVFTAGLGLWIRKGLGEAGHLALCSAIGVGGLACLLHAYRTGGGFSPGRLESPSATHDYLLFLACLLYGTWVTYLELRWGVLGEAWTAHLLGSALLYGLLAHYFDNRLVLSLSLTTLGAWWGVKVSLLGIGELGPALRWHLLAYGGAVVAAGGLSAWLAWKPHFLPVHLHLGGNALLVGAFSGTVESAGAWLPALLALAAAAAVYGLRSRSFAFLAYGVLYGYAGLTAFLWPRWFGGQLGPALYALVSSVVVVFGLVWVHRRFKVAP